MEEVDHLLELVKKQRVYEPASRDLTSTVEHIGEAVPLTKDGKCPTMYLVPNKDNTQCILPSRIDIAKHYFAFGGRESLKEYYESLVSRLQVFTGFFFNDLNDPVLAPLFKSEQYLKAATAACGGN
jgi:uncharacterized protein with NRDE domain